MISDLVRIVRAGPEDAAALFQLQKEAYASEGRLYPYLIPPLTETEAETAADIARSFVLKAVTADGGLVGSVRAVRTAPDTCQLRRLMVLPAYRGRGSGSQLLRAIESAFPDCVCRLFTGTRSHANIRLYLGLGYTVERVDEQQELIYFSKASRHTSSGEGQ